jgi:hypothetical protein
MDQGLIGTPNKRSFVRFTTKALWTPDGSIHGNDLGNILMVSSAYNPEIEKVPYAFNGQNVIVLEEAVLFAPAWTIKGNQFSTRIKALLLAGTKQADVVQSAATGATQTINGVQLGATYDLGVRGISNITVLVGATPKTLGTDVEVDPVTGFARILEGGAIAAAANVIFNYDVPALTREEYTAFDNQNQLGTLRCMGLRFGDVYVNEEAIFSGNLYTDKLGDSDPKKHRDWEMKLSTSGVPRFRTLKI